MGLNYTHALGRNGKFFAKVETSAGTFIKPAATDAIKALKTKIGFSQERKDRMDNRATRDVLERITGKKKIPWTMETYLIPSGAAGTAPDIGVLMQACLGVETINGGVSAAYTLSDSQTARGTLSIVHEFNSVLMEAAFGCNVNKVTLKGSGGEPPTVTFDGNAQGHIHTGTSTLNGSTSGTTATVQTADKNNFEVGSVLKVGSNDNSGAGFKVTAKNNAVLTLEGSPSGSNADAVIPFVPSETVAGSPIPGIVGSLTWNGGSTPITSWEVSVDNTDKLIEDEAFQAAPTDYVPSWRKVTGKIGIRVRKDLVILIGHRKAYPTLAISIVCGTTAGSICTISVPYAECDFSDVNTETSDEVTVELPFVGLGSAGADSISITFT